MTEPAARRIRRARRRCGDRRARARLRGTGSRAQRHRSSIGMRGPSAHPFATSVTAASPRSPASCSSLRRSHAKSGWSTPRRPASSRSQSGAVRDRTKRGRTRGTRGTQRIAASRPGRVADRTQGQGAARAWVAAPRAGDHRWLRCCATIFGSILARRCVRWHAGSLRSRACVSSGRPATWVAGRGGRATSRGDIRASRTILCVGHDLDYLFPELAATARRSSAARCR